MLLIDGFFSVSPLFIILQLNWYIEKSYLERHNNSSKHMQGIKRVCQKLETIGLGRETSIFSASQLIDMHF